MKLSAPPPPPPEPNDPTPPADGAEATTGTPEPPPAPAEPAGKPATWPGWFAGADFALAVLALVLVFLLASFAARNSDLWLHLAAGKRLLAGEYTPGTDPFSYTAADRTWVNHSLLYDAGSYLLFDAAGGGALVLAKAVAAALAFGLLIGIRRPGFPLWPWAAVAAVGAVAAAPYLTLRPIVGSVLLLAVTLVLLFRVPHRPGSWRFPAAVGVTFWVWAMTDEWFFLGPLALALVLVGELIQGPRTPADEAAPEPLGRLPDVPTLARALGVGVVACMLNPHHVRVWQLPFELVGAAGVGADERFKLLVAGPLGDLYRNRPGLGYNQNGLAFAALFVGGWAVVGLGGRVVRFSHLALWAGFALLSLLTVQAIPFLAVVAVPLIAGQLNAASAGVALKTWGDPRTRYVLLGSAGGRAAVLLAVLAGCVLAWPGWVQPPTTNPAFARRVGWAVEPEPAAVRAAGQLQAWREADRLPADVRGLVASADLANYCAWFAPAERVYANARYNHHRPELPDFVAARVGLGLVKTDEEADPKALARVLRQAGAGYVAVYTGVSEPAAAGSAVGQWLDEAHWSPWYFDGRAAVSGWRESAGAGGPAFDALRVDPVVLAFGPGVERVPAGRARPPAPRGWAEAFVRPPDPPPAGADEARAWADYARVRQGLIQARQHAIAVAWYLADRVAFPWLDGRGPLALMTPSLPVEDAQRAAPVLALRAARRAVAAAPDHPDGYLALDWALQDRFLPLPDADRGMRWIARATALRQCLARLPAPDDFRHGVHAASPTLVAWTLAGLYLGRDVAPFPTGVPVDVPGSDVLAWEGAAQVPWVLTKRVKKGGTEAEVREVVRRPVGADRFGDDVVRAERWPGGPFLLPLDLAREALQTADRYAAVELNQTDQAKRFREEIKGLLKAVEGELGRESNAYDQALRGDRKPADQVRAALRHSLPGEALKLLTDKDLDPDRDLGPDAPRLLLCRVALELAVGRLEDAAADLDALAESPGFQQRLADPHLGRAFHRLRYQRLVLEGNYDEAGRVLEDVEGRALREDPLKPVRDQFDPTFYVGLKPVAVGPRRPSEWLLGAAPAALLAPTPGDLVARVRGPVIGLTAFDLVRNNWAEHRAAQVKFFFDRGVLHLLEGDIPEAEKRFLQTRLPEVKEWGLPPPGAALAEQYLRLIGKAGQRADGK